MARTAASFARRPPRYDPQPRILILCEDRKSCLTYLREAARHFRCYADAVEVDHVGKTDPRGIVAAAKRRRKDYDLVYCAIDRDTHETFDEAISHASNAPAVEVIVSHPCYEFWLLLHFRETRSPASADELVRALRKHAEMSAYAKGESAGLFDRLLARLPKARERSARVLLQATDQGEMNPSTRLHDLIVLFESHGKPIPLKR